MTWQPRLVQPPTASTNPRNERLQTAAEFWALVDVGKPEECWPWKGKLSPGGYGDVGFRGQRWKASALALYLWRGVKTSRPEKVYACHECNNKACCNPLPGHVYAGSPRSNYRDMVRAGTFLGGSSRRHDRIGRDHAAFFAWLDGEG